MLLEIKNKQINKYDKNLCKTYSVSDNSLQFNIYRPVLHQVAVDIASVSSNVPQGQKFLPLGVFHKQKST